MPAGRIQAAFDVVRHLGLGQLAAAVGFVVDPLRLQRGENLSIAALSKTFPDRLNEQVTLLSAIVRWNCSLVYRLPWLEWFSSASGFLRRQIATTRKWMIYGGFGNRLSSIKGSLTNLRFMVTRLSRRWAQAAAPVSTPALT
jgi:hypothetical protein